MGYLLIVDDDEDFTSAVAKVLECDGHEVRAEFSPYAAIRTMKARAPDLVILDVMFPEDGAAGFKLARVMRDELPHMKDVPVLILSALNDRFPLGFGKHDIHDTLLPVADCLDKPVEFDLLRERVSHLLRVPDA